MGKEGRQAKGQRQEGETVIYKRGCNTKGANGTCNKCGERGACGVYWYKFMWQGKLVRESTKQGNDKVARQMEAAHRTSLAKGEVGLRARSPSMTLADLSTTVSNRGRRPPLRSRRLKMVLVSRGLRAIKRYKPLADS